MKQFVCNSKAGRTRIVCKIDYSCSSSNIIINDDMRLRTIRLKERKEAPNLKLAKLCAL
jgi:hypothetical protein